VDNDEKTEGPPQRLRRPTAADFEVVDFEAPVRQSNYADAHDLFGLFPSGDDRLAG